MENNANKPKSSNLLYKIALGLLLLIVVYLVIDKIYQSNNKARLMEELEVTISRRDSLANEYSQLSKDYSTLKTNNDTINARLAGEQKKVEEMVKQIKAIRSGNKVELEKYKAELETLRKIMRGYIVQLDSLNTANQILVAENKEVREKYMNEKSNREELESEKKELSSKVQVASALKAKDIQVAGLNSKGNLTGKMDKIDKISVCFVLPENEIAAKGIKDIFVRISAPSGEVFAKSQNNLFKFQGKDIGYSAKRQVEYNGLETEACIYWTVDRELKAGTYNIGVFADGYELGSSVLTLR